MDKRTLYHRWMGEMQRVWEEHGSGPFKTHEMIVVANTETMDLIAGRHAANIETDFGVFQVKIDNEMRDGEITASRTLAHVSSEGDR